MSNFKNIYTEKVEKFLSQFPINKQSSKNGSDLSFLQEWELPVFVSDVIRVKVDDH